MSGKFASGQLVLVPDERLVCRPARVARCNGYPPRMAITLEPLEGGGAFTPSAEQAELICEADPLALEGAPDLVKLTHLNEFAILHDLRARYARDEVYTFVGTILVAINPFKDVSHLDEAILARARAADARSWDELPPHVYVLAEGAYRAALRERKPQAILISGESGAGKTESTKLWLRHLVSRSQGAAGGGSGSAASRIEASLLHCNPVLETFGNAATTRNHNSSRFGKWVEVSLDARAGGTISAARLTCYLLERSRVTGHAPGERGFHAFYQLLAALKADAALARRLSLEPAPGQYRYLRAGANGAGGAAAVRTEDAERRAACSAALSALGLGGEHAAALDSVVGAVLHVGNVTFDAASAGEHQDEGAAIQPASLPHLRSAAALLGVGADAVADALTVRLVGRFPAVRVPLSTTHAAAQRDALARALYAALFESHLFAQLNRTMHGISSGGHHAGGAAYDGGGGPDGAAAGGQSSGTGEGGSTGDDLYIGCLDIFGFECFAVNGLEQLLINYANERLHHLFNVHVFEMDLRQLSDDGIELLSTGKSASLAYGENAATLQLLHGGRAGGVGGAAGAGAGAGGGSLLSLLSEEVALPNGTDLNYLEKCISLLRAAGPFVTPRGGAADRQFGVRHYAGAVSYSVDGFVEKNRNAVPPDLVGLLAASEVPLLAAVFGEMKRATDSAAAGAGGGARTRAAPGGRKPAGRGGAGAGALSAVFTRSLDALLDRLGTTSLHFVRCVKPNAALAANSLDAAFALVQLRYMGMLAVAEVRKRGYAHRMSHAAFLERYAMLLPARDAEGALGAAHGEPSRAACETLFARLPPALAAAAGGGNGGGAEADGALRPFAVGRTLVCMRAPLHAALEAAREVAVRAQLLERVAAEAGAARPSVSALQQVVSLALEVGLEGEPVVQRALKTLRLLREREEVAAALRSQLARGGGGGGGWPEPSLLDELVRRAKAVGVDAELVAQAEALLARARDSGRAEAALRAALKQAGSAGAAGGGAAGGGGIDSQQLLELIKAAARLDVSAELLQQARREAEAMAERERVLAALRAAAARPVGGGPGAPDEVERLAELLARAAQIGLSRCAEVEGAQARLDEADERSRRAQAGAAAAGAAAGASSGGGGGGAQAGSEEEAVWEEAEEGEEEAEAEEERSPHLQRLGAARTSAPLLAPLCQPIAQRLAQLEAGVEASCFLPAQDGPGAAAKAGGWALARGRLALSQDHLSLLWTPHAEPSMAAAGAADEAAAGAGARGAQPGSFFDRVAQVAVQAVSGSPFSPRAGAGGAGGAGGAHGGAHGGVRAVRLAVTELDQISVGPQSQETREALKRERARQRVGGAERLAQYLVVALTTAGGTASGGSGQRHCEFVLDDCEAALLCVCTLEELCVRYDAPAGREGKFGALQRAQRQWFEFAASAAARAPPASAGSAAPAGAVEPVLPLLAPLYDLLDAAATWLGMRVLDYSVLWLLVEMVELPLPPGLLWVPVDSRQPSYALRRVAICEEASGAMLQGHPYEAHFRAKLERCLSHAGAAGALHHATDPQQVVEEALSWRGRPPAKRGAGAQRGGGARPGARRGAHAAAAPPAGVQIYKAIFAGSVDGVQRFLDQGGPVDGYYRTEWGWEGVSSEWAWTQPTAGTTPLNYVATLLDVIGDDVAAQMARVLLDAGADPLCDDCLQQWFMPVHNAAANGGPLTVAELLLKDGDLANATTGEGQTTLFVAALCERPDDRRRVIKLLLEHGADTSFVEPFRGDTALHEYARRGLSAEVGMLCDNGANPLAKNNAGHTPCVAGEHTLDALLSSSAGGAGSSGDAGAWGSLSTVEREELVNGLTNTIQLLSRRALGMRAPKTSTGNHESRRGSYY